MGDVTEQPYDAAADVRAMRDEDNEIVAAKWARIDAQPPMTDDEADEAGRRLLRELGLAE